MITHIRRHVQKTGFKVILWLVLLAFVGEMFVRRRAAGPSADAIGYVNSYPILKDSYARKVGQENQLIQKIKDQLGADADMFLAQQGYLQKPEERVLNELIQEKLVHTAINQVGAKISPDYIERKIADPMFVMDSLQDYIPQEAYMHPGGLNIQAVLHYLQRQGISDDQFETKVKSSIEKLLLQEFLASAVYIPKALIKEQYIRFYAKKKFGLLTFTVDNYIKRVKAEMPQIKEDELKSFFHSNSQLYVVPEKRNGKLFTFTPATYGINVTDKEVEEYYLKHKAQYIDKPEELSVRRILLKNSANAAKAGEASKKTQKKEKAAEATEDEGSELVTPKPSAEADGTKDRKKELEVILQEAKAHPDKFEELAQKKSESSDKGKILSVKRGEFINEKDPRYELAALALEKDGDISPVTQVKEGWVIVQRMSRKEPVYKPLAKAKEEIKKQLLQDKFNRLFNLDAQRIIAQAQDTPDIFTKFIANKKAEEKPTGNITKADGNILAKKLFSLPVNGKAFYQQENKGYIVELTTVTKSYLPELATIKEKVTADFYKHKAVTLMTEEMSQAREKLLAGLTNIEAVGKEFKVPFTTTDWVDFKSEEAPKFFEEKKIAIDRVKLLSQVNSLVEEFTQTHGYIIQLNEIEPIKDEDFAQKKEELARSLFQSELSMLNLTLMTALRNNAKITINQDMVKQVAGTAGRARRYA